MFQKHICPPWCEIQVYLLCRSKTCLKQVSNWCKDIERTTQWAQEWFDLDLWTCDLKINRDHLLAGHNPCTEFGIDQVKRSKDIERSTQWAEKSGMTLTFEHVTRKSIGIIYSLRVTSAPSLLLIKWRGQEILSGQHLVYRPIDRPTDGPMDWLTYRLTDSCKTMFPFSGIKIFYNNLN